MIDVIAAAIGMVAVAVAGVFLTLINDNVDAAIIAGAFSILNTIILGRMSLRQKRVEQKTHEVKEIVDRRVKDEGHSPERRQG